MEKHFQDHHQKEANKIREKSKKISPKKTSTEAKLGNFKDVSGQINHKKEVKIREKSQKATRRSGKNEKLTKKTSNMESKFKDMSANKPASNSTAWKQFFYDRKEQRKRLTSSQKFDIIK